MRIISRKFKDYYDGVGAGDLDKSLVYVREPKTVDLSKNYPFPTFFYYQDWGNLYITNFTIGFCGQLYPCVRMIKFVPATEKDITSYCYKVENVDEFVEANYKEKQIDDYKSKKIKYNKMKWPWDARQEKFAKFFAEFPRRVQEMNQEKIRKQFEDNHCPLFVGRSEAGYRKRDADITYNACLKDVEFFRIFDAYRAYQEISMYLGNIAEPGKVIPKIDDETLLQAKGFDVKSSFRKEPSKKK